MNSFKVVTVCSTDSGHCNRGENCFLPFRRGLTKEERNAISKSKSRSQSASLSSVLKPIAFSELKNELPLLLRQKRDLIMQRNGSVDSDILRKEINSAVLLLESRNKIDMSLQTRIHYRQDASLGECHDKIHDKNKISESAQAKMERHTLNGVSRWKSAKVSENKSNQDIPKHCNYRMLPYKCGSPLKTNNVESKIPFKEPKNVVNFNNSKDNLIISSSNLLTHSVTVDDISGAKHCWIESNKTITPEKNVSDYKSIVNYLENPEKLQSRHKREDVLRKYMDLYMHWRTVNAIEEYHLLINGKSLENLSTKIRNATPKQRLEQFRNNAYDRKHFVRKHSNTDTKDISKDAPPVNVVVKSNIVNLKPFKTTEVDVNPVERSSDVIDSEQDVKVPVVLQEDEEESNSDLYSEIDWLDCVDI